MKHLRLILLLVVLPLAFACERRPLVSPDFKTRIDVEVTIEAIANVTCDVYNDKIPPQKIEPEVLRVMFFGMEDDKMLGESFISNRATVDSMTTVISGSLSILPGDYRILIYGFGTETSLVDSYDSWNNSKVYTNSISEETLKALSLKAPAGSQAIHYQPDHMIVARSEHENIPWHSGSHVIHAEAKSVVESYYLQVMVEGLEYVSSARAVLSSMSPNVAMVTAEPDMDNPVSIYIPLEKSDDKGVPVVCNVFNTFGRIPDSSNRLEVTFDIKTVDGRTITKEFEISDLFLSQECIEHHWLLVEETIVVPPPPDPGPGSGSGGFDPSVSDWEKEEHEIEM